MAARAVVFDLFGTLIDDSPPAAYARFLEETARRLDADPERFRALWEAHDVARYTGPIEDCFEAICRKLGVPDFRDALAFRLEHLRRILVPRPDAETTLHSLRERGLRLGMISNASGEVSGLWAETPLAPLFDAVLFSADERLMKPDPRLYRRMAARLGVAPEECLFVGDGA
jgi:putative hydrolase of the HAD superfamily